MGRGGLPGRRFLTTILIAAWLAGAPPMAAAPAVAGAATGPEARTEAGPAQDGRPAAQAGESLWYRVRIRYRGKQHFRDFRVKDDRFSDEWTADVGVEGEARALVRTNARGLATEILVLRGSTEATVTVNDQTRRQDVSGLIDERSCLESSRLTLGRPTRAPLAYFRMIPGVRDWTPGLLIDPLPQRTVTRNKPALLCHLAIGNRPSQVISVAPPLIFHPAHEQQVQPVTRVPMWQTRTPRGDDGPRKLTPRFSREALHFQKGKSTFLTAHLRFRPPTWTVIRRSDFHRVSLTITETWAFAFLPCPGNRRC